MKLAVGSAHGDRGYAIERARVHQLSSARTRIRAELQHKLSKVISLFRPTTECTDVQPIHSNTCWVIFMSCKDNVLSMSILQSLWVAFAAKIHGSNPTVIIVILVNLPILLKSRDIGREL